MLGEVHPLDFQALKKDMTIERPLIERIYNVRKDRAPEEYRLCLLRLKQDIERERRDLLCCIKGDEIRVMTDSEGNEHTWKEFRYGVRKIVRQVRRRAAIDTNQLTAAERRTADLRDAHVSMQAIMLRRELAKAEREMLFSGKAQSNKLIDGEVTQETDEEDPDPQDQPDSDTGQDKEE